MTKTSSTVPSEGPREAAAAEETCTLSILVARTDVPYLRHTVPHLSRVCSDACQDRVLIVDTARVSGFYRRSYGRAPEFEALFEVCEELRGDGWVDRIAPIDYDPGRRRELLERHFGRDLRHTHDVRGYPILGSIFALEEAEGDYFVHFDCDMLIHQAPGFSWVREGIRLLREEEEAMFVLPRSGPPRDDGELVGQSHPYELDPRGFYRFENFTSRVFLVDRRRFRELLPLTVRHRGGFRQRLVRRLRGESSLDSWERMVTSEMRRNPYYRADLATEKAWSLHPPEKGAEFLRSLPEIIAKVEAGWYPEEQAGHYDLKLAEYV